jgi:methionyl-tRNA formyltransferase
MAIDSEHAYIVLGVKSWNRRVYSDVISKYPGRWTYLDSPAALNQENLSAIQPRYVFSLHWSWKIPAELIATHEFVCFHMTDVPYGRGGSPLQNLVSSGHRKTRLTALQMTTDFDEGPIYLKEDLSLEGNAEEIYIRACYLSAKMIERIIREHPLPVPQQGEVVTFKRRRPAESAMPDLSTLQDVHDFIRMLDAEGYPRAYLTHNGFRYEFSRAALYDGKIVADVTIKRVEDNVREGTGNRGTP